MFRSSWLGVAGAFALALLAAAVAYVVSPFSSARPPAPQPWNGPVHRSFVALPDSVDLAYRQAEGQAVDSSGHVYGGIIPHHLIAQDKIAAFFGGLEGTRYDTVILFSPNHFRQGNARAITSLAQWQTPYGSIQPDSDVVRALVGAGATVDEAPFESEHGIYNLVPFVRRSLPDASIAPVILDVSSTAAEVQSLADAIRGATDSRRTLVLASVDFSHYLPTYVADFHDRLAAGVLESADLGRVGELEVDSPSSLSLLLRYLAGVGAQRAQQLFHTNSGTLLNDPDVPGTSHLLYYFTAGQPSPVHVANALFFGDIMLDRNVAKVIAARGFSYLLDGLAGEEGRFFGGVDLVGANLEGAVTDGGAHYPPEAGNDFAFSPSTVAQLQRYGFSYFTLANNHSLDQGRRGLNETEENLSQLGYLYSGCPDAAVGDCSATTTSLGGISVGLAGFSMVYHPFDLDEAAAIVSRLASSTDFVTVNVHWGTEYEHEFRTSQQAVAHRLIEAGADVIIGHHPHVVQGVERYRGKLIFYSLGNFIFDQYFSTDTQRGLGVGLTLTQPQPGAPVAYEARLFPVRSDSSRVTLLIGDEREQFLHQLATWSTVPEFDLDSGVIAAE